jgi:hypothetical protein
MAEFDSTPNADVKLNSLAYWVEAVGTFGPVYVGGISFTQLQQAAFVPGGILNAQYSRTLDKNFQFPFIILFTSKAKIAKSIPSGNRHCSLP